MNFDVDKIGRTIANTSINDFASNYRANNWGYNGPGVITRTLEKICGTNLVSKSKKKNQYIHNPYYPYYQSLFDVIIFN